MKIWIACVLVSVSAVSAVAQERERPPADTRDPACGSMPETKRRQTDACKTDEERREDEHAKVERERAEKEKPTHSSFLKWVQVDAPLVPTITDGSSVGVVGLHIAVANIDRLYLYGPPGVMLIVDHAGVGSRVRPAFTWGFGWYVTDFRLTRNGRPAQLYINLVKCWTNGVMQTGEDMVGLSFSWKKNK
jgi:hypothetical protein